VVNLPHTLSMQAQLSYLERRLDLIIATAVAGGGNVRDVVQYVIRQARDLGIIEELVVLTRREPSDICKLFEKRCKYISKLHWAGACR
jgi:hypothetical protein